MATTAPVSNLQTLQYNAMVSEGGATVPAIVTVVTGIMEASLFSQGAGNWSASFESLIGPVLAPGKFRLATACASIMSHGIGLPATGASNVTLSITDVEATLNDQSGQVQIIVDTQVVTSGTATGFLQNINFQVTILAVA